MDSKTRQTSLDACGLVKEGGDRAFVQKYPPYLSFVALAMYYAAWTVPEATFVAVFLARFVLDPNEACFKAGISLMSYLYHTRTERIRYTKSGWTLPPAINDAGLNDSVMKNYGMYFSPDSSWKIKHGSGLNMTYGGAWAIFMFGAAVDWSTKLIKVILGHMPQLGGSRSSCRLFLWETMHVCAIILERAKVDGHRVRY